MDLSTLLPPLLKGARVTAELETLPVVGDYVRILVAKDDVAVDDPRDAETAQPAD